jgi:hypothetical protein
VDRRREYGLSRHDDWFSPVSKRTRIFRRLGTAKRPALDFPRRQPVRVEASHAAATPRFHVFGAMDRYIHLPAGEATLDILSVVRKPLKPALRAMFHDAVRRSRETVLETIRSTRGSHRMSFRITVRPLDGPTGPSRSASSGCLVCGGWDRIQSRTSQGPRSCARPRRVIG